MERAWLPEELKAWEVARKVLGVILRHDRALADPPKWYESLYREKLLQLAARALRRKENYIDQVDTYLLEGAKLEFMLPSKPKPNDLLACLEELDNWPDRPSRALNAYLQKKGSLKAVKESLGLLDEYRHPVSDKEFLMELKELSLEEFLELAARP